MATPKQKKPRWANNDVFNILPVFSISFHCLIFPFFVDFVVLLFFSVIFSAQTGVFSQYSGKAMKSKKEQIMKIFYEKRIKSE